jgi:SAM-dependent methyltransferase
MPSLSLGDLGAHPTSIGSVILPRHYPPAWHEFNQEWGAPDGYRSFVRRAAYRVARKTRDIGMQGRAIGPFGFQPDNNSTRSAEYPWAFHARPIVPGHVAVDLGGSLGGFQFVLSKCGAQVVNVDPSDSAVLGRPVSGATITALNRAFGTTVELRKAFLQDAGFQSETVDRVYCISTIEHIPCSEIPSLAADIGRILKPGGFAVLTIDLFYDLVPFTKTPRNIHGTNINVHDLVEASNLELDDGNAAELCGYQDFDPVAVQGRAMEFVQGDHALNTTQAIVLRKL